MAARTKTKWECKGKRQYKTKDEAFEEIYFMMEESFGGYTNLRPYLCKFCHEWHLTSKD